MLCYRDMTFCKYDKQCLSGKDCHRALTEEVMKGAEAHGLGVMVFAEHPWCFEAKKEVMEDEQTA